MFCFISEKVSVSTFPQTQKLQMETSVVDPSEKFLRVKFLNGVPSPISQIQLDAGFLV